MTRSFDPFVLQIKRKFGSAMPFIGNQKQFLPELRFEIITNLLNFRGH